jgi:hypothetical protein
MTIVWVLPLVVVVDVGVAVGAGVGVGVCAAATLSHNKFTSTTALMSLAIRLWLRRFILLLVASLADLIDQVI